MPTRCFTCPEEGRQAAAKAKGATPAVKEERNFAGVNGLANLKIEGQKTNNSCWPCIVSRHKEKSEPNRWYEQIRKHLLSVVEEPFSEGLALTENIFEDQRIIDLADELATKLNTAVSNTKTLAKKKDFHTFNAAETLNQMKELATTTVFTFDRSATNAPTGLHPQYRLSNPGQLDWKTAIKHMLVLQAGLGNLKDSNKKYYNENKEEISVSRKEYYKENREKILATKKEDYQAKTAWIWDGSTKEKRIEEANEWRKYMMVEKFTKAAAGRKHVSTTEGTKTRKKAKVF